MLVANNAKGGIYFVASDQSLNIGLLFLISPSCNAAVCCSRPKNLKLFKHREHHDRFFSWHLLHSFQ